MRLTINQQPVELPEHISILEAIHTSGQSLLQPCLGEAKEWIRSPLCPQMCLAECDGQLVTLPALKRRLARDGMTIETRSHDVQRALEERGTLLAECHECYFIREWQKAVVVEGESGGFTTLQEWEGFTFEKRQATPSIFHDPNKCIRCQACIDTCRDIQGVEALSLEPKQGVLVDDQRCVRCGQCIHHCPMGALGKNQPMVEFLECGDCPFATPLGAMREVDDTMKAWSLLHDSQRYCVAEFAPSIRASLGEAFGIPAGDLTTGRIYAALRRLGFKKVWDTNFAADLTIMEEGSEFIERVAKDGTLPMFTSCCPAWIRFAETFFPDLLPHLSTAKSPQQMFGAIAKSYGAASLGVPATAMSVISIMPCTAKKYEHTRTEMAGASAYWQEQQASPSDGRFPDVDVVLTTRELARMLKMAGVELAHLPDEDADPLLGEYSGAASIFGRTGGVMEAALRTTITLLTSQSPHPLEFDDLGGTDGIKCATLPLGEKTFKVAVVHGLANARKVCESVRQGGEFAQYHFIEIMACPGGCIAGGGQLIPTNGFTKRARAQGLNHDDRDICSLRMSHENPEIKTLYASFLKEPLSHLGHQLLHTTYTDRTVNNVSSAES